MVEFPYHNESGGSFVFDTDAQETGLGALVLQMGCQKLGARKDVRLRTKY